MRSASSFSLNEEVVEEVEVPQDYTSMTLAELREIAKEKGIEGYAKLKKAELIEALG